MVRRRHLHLQCTQYKHCHPSFLPCYKSCLAVTVLHVMKKVYCKTSRGRGAVKVYSSEGKVSVRQVSGGDCAQEAVVTVVTVVTMVTVITVDVLRFNTSPALGLALAPLQSPLTVPLREARQLS